MATRTLDSAVRLTLDGHQQVVRFETTDGEPIPHEAGDLTVKLNGEPLKEGAHYTISKSGETTCVVLLQKHPRGYELSVERFTKLNQLRRLRRAKGATLENIEGGLDHITRAVQDNIRRLSDVERIVSVEHRVVEMPADAPTVDPALVVALEKHMANSGMSDDDKAQLAETIAAVVMMEFAALHNDLARRVAALETQMNRLAAVTEDIAA